MTDTLTLQTRPIIATLAAVWVGTAAASAFTADTLGPALLAAQPLLPPSCHPWLIWGGAALDLMLGLAMWLKPGRLVWGTALVATAGMTAVATWVDPSLWWHPLGPLTKNLPLIALLWALRKASP